MRKKLWAATMLLLALAWLLYACGVGTETTSPRGRTIQVGQGSYQNVSPSQLDTMLRNKDFLLINVHVPYGGEIPQTDLFIPYDEIEQNLSKLPQDKGAKIVLYCRSGSMSAIAAETMVRLGYTNIWNLDGGMSQWQNQGLPHFH